jgi:hypothetical protein
MPVVGAVRIGQGEGGDLIRKNARQRRLGHRDDAPAPSKRDLALAVSPHGAMAGNAFSDAADRLHERRKASCLPFTALVRCAMHAFRCAAPRGKWSIS